MKPRKPEQIVQILHEADSELAKGLAIEDFCRAKPISSATYYRWKKKYGALTVQDAKRLKALEVEAAKLKRLLAEALLANDALQEHLSKKA
jgi:putative transposase